MLGLVNGLSGWAVLAFVLAYLSALLVAMSFHEFAHAFVATKQGDPTPKAYKRLTLKAFNHVDALGFISLLIFHFGWAKPVPVNPLNFKHRKSGEFFVSIAGILTNLILAFAFSGIYILLFVNYKPWFVSNNFYAMLLSNFLEISIIINISLAIFNLLPIYPLDGFRIVETFSGPNSGFSQFMKQYSFIILIILLISGLTSAIIGFVGDYVISGFLNFWLWVASGFKAI